MGRDPELELAQAYEATFAQSPAGRLVMADLERQFNRQAFTAGDPHATSFRCGTMEVLYYIASQLRLADQYEPPVTEITNG